MESKETVDGNFDVSHQSAALLSRSNDTADVGADSNLSGDIIIPSTNIQFANGGLGVTHTHDNYIPPSNNNVMQSSSYSLLYNSTPIMSSGLPNPPKQHNMVTSFQPLSHPPVYGNPIYHPGTYQHPTYPAVFNSHTTTYPPISHNNNYNFASLHPSAANGPNGYLVPMQSTSGGPTMLPLAPVSSPEYTMTSGVPYAVPVTFATSCDFSVTSASSGGTPVTLASNGGPPITLASDGGYPVTLGSNVCPPVTLASDGGPPVTSTSDGGHPVILSSNGDPHVTLTSDGGPPVTLASNAGPPVTLASNGGPIVTLAFNGGPPDTMASNGNPSVTLTSNGAAPDTSAYSGGPPVSTSISPVISMQSAPTSHTIDDTFDLSTNYFPDLKAPKTSSINSSNNIRDARSENPIKSTNTNISSQSSFPTSNSLYAAKIGTKNIEEIVKKEQGIILHSGSSDICSKIPSTQLIRYVGAKIGPKNIISASRISNGRFCMFLKSEQIANSFVYNNPVIKINNHSIYVRQYANSAEKLVISNVSSPIPNSILESVLKAHLQVEIVSPIHHMSFGMNDKEYSHLTNFRRYVFIKYDADAVNIPESIVFVYDKLSYQIYLTVESNRCRICPDEYHTVKRCPKVKKDQPSRDLSERLKQSVVLTENPSPNNPSPHSTSASVINSSQSSNPQEPMNDSSCLESMDTIDVRAPVYGSQEKMDDQGDSASKRKQLEEQASSCSSEETFEEVGKKSRPKKKKTSKNNNNNTTNNQTQNEKRPSNVTLQDYFKKVPEKSTQSLENHDEYNEITEPLQSIIQELAQKSSEPVNMNVNDIIHLLDDCKHSRKKPKKLESSKLDKARLQSVFIELLNNYPVSLKLKNRIKNIQLLLITDNKLPLSS